MLLTEDPSINPSFSQDSAIHQKQVHKSEEIKDFASFSKRSNKIQEYSGSYDSPDHKSGQKFQFENDTNGKQTEESKKESSIKLLLLEDKEGDNQSTESFFLNSGTANDFKKSKPLTISVIQERLKKSPYDKAIQELLNLPKCLTPIEKIKCISQISKTIVQCINKFWDGIKIKKEKLTIDGDTLLMIYIYVCLKSRMIDLFAQIKIMNEFSTPFVRTTKLGYCLSTLEVALNHILNLTK